MTITLTIVTLSILMLILAGLFLEFSPGSITVRNRSRLKKGLGINLAVFAVGIAATFMMGVDSVMAATEAATQGKEISTGLGLALLGIGLPTGLATIGAGIAVSSVGAASLAVITEKPDMFGRTLIYLGLAEGIAIYGLVMSILLLGKI